MPFLPRGRFHVVARTDIRPAKFAFSRPIVTRKFCERAFPETTFGVNVPIVHIVVTVAGLALFLNVFQLPHSSTMNSHQDFRRSQNNSRIVGRLWRTSFVDVFGILKQIVLVNAHTLFTSPMIVSVIAPAVPCSACSDS